MSSEDLKNACRLGDLQKANQLLLSNPFLLNQGDKSLGWAPLYRTVICGHFSLSNFLLNQGACPNIQNRLGQTPLHQSVSNDNLKLTKLLLSHKANPNIPQNDGDTALHLASIHGHQRIIKCLLSYGADPNTQNKVFQKTPLHYAVQNRHSESVKILIEAKTNLEILDSEGKKAEDLTENQDILQLFQDFRDQETEENLNQNVEFISSPRSFSTNPSFEQTYQLEIGNLTPFLQSLNSSFIQRSPLYNWLLKYGLQQIHTPLQIHGFDDLKCLVQSIKIQPLSLKNLKQIGIKKPGHRIRFILLLENQHRLENRFKPKYKTDIKH